ncbi:aspartate carbamoyltransferase catalytic subunit [Photobacterium iliopiscarium]|jgi:aspartate carbamoyltransferase catalytic subunit|uniref:Aspartate carbamoyltransferase n=1 Tax=Photobacterium iliopiscarium TaxID=56192 RepID=A0A0D8PZT2_9GAMM|nr:aspartate carbamoyltransferase [Photobacterium iliopiscarium]KJG14173.1 aspartate carbamoyltransferase catalytic subunit [Photobacterium iliopiscarium]KJG24090.1 aspartate carbamoyltransferase catalytic subunit [Photobacterium iliopiscarium]MCD9467499.1 aspartate carbamoyltransferase [Photobacterium iliopiscarium]MCD9487186.1 aspartate carbamoyltransferase [Photobacterium iliopiscarium]MCF2243758.1 aspartate carbamoyltransferase [Photobacterium iliopiscarium]
MANSLFKKHIISIPELNRAELELIIETAARLKAEPNPTLLKNKVVASCFFEPSTRTRLSFETAIQRLGGTVVGFDSPGNTSLANKGETLSDSVQVITSYVDAFVMRHPQEGAARLASEFSNGVPVINGGDGANQHPTQTLLDLFTIHETQGRLDGINIAFVGDLKYGRTVHSLTQALSKFNDVKFFFIAPEVLAMPDYICEELDDAGISYSLHNNMEDVIPELDILYMTRVQKERFDESEYVHMKAAYILTANMLESARDNLKVLHPLPRVDEITVDVDKTKYAYFFQQAENGVYARQALLALVLNETL